MSVVTIASNILTGLFISSFVIGIASFFYGMFEKSRMMRMNSLTFNKGFKVLEFKNQLFSFSKKDIILDNIIVTDKCKYKFLTYDTCIFINKSSSYGSFYRWKSHVPLKGTLYFSINEVTVTGRLPMGSFIFMLAWLTGFLSEGLRMVINGTLSNGHYSIFIVWTLFFMLDFLSLQFEKDLLRDAYYDLKRRIETTI